MCVIYQCFKKTWSITRHYFHQFLAFVLVGKTKHIKRFLVNCVSEKLFQMTLTIKMSFISVTGNLNNQLSMSSKTSFFFIFMLFYLRCYPNAGNLTAARWLGVKKCFSFVFLYICNGNEEEKREMDKRTVNSSLQIYWVKLTISGVIAPIRRMIQTDWLKFIKYFPSWSCRGTDRVGNLKISLFGRNVIMEKETTWRQKKAGNQHYLNYLLNDISVSPSVYTSHISSS